MDYSMYIDSKYYIIVAMLYGIGVLLKGHPKIKNWSIPMILCVIGIICVTGVELQEGNHMNIMYIIKGVVCGLTSVGTNQIYKQSKEVNKKEEINEEPVEDEVIEDNNEEEEITEEPIEENKEDEIIEDLQDYDDGPVG